VAEGENACDRGGVRSGDEGGEHGHELKTRRSGDARTPRRGVALPYCRDARRVGGARAPGAGTQNRRSRGLYAEGYEPNEGGAVPESWIEQNET
jgi:hypothetical protein